LMSLLMFTCMQCTEVEYSISQCERTKAFMVLLILAALLPYFNYLYTAVSLFLVKNLKWPLENKDSSN
jgi:hypothetical protein